MVGGSGADLLTFNNVVGNTYAKGFGQIRDFQDTVVFSSSASDVNVDLAAGADSLSFSKGATNATVAAAAGNDTVVAALTLASSSVEAAAGDDSLSISVLSLSTRTGGSGAVSLNLAKAVSSEVYANQMTSSLPQVTQLLLPAARALTPLSLQVMPPAAKSLATPAQTASPSMELLVPLWFTVVLVMTP